MVCSALATHTLDIPQRSPKHGPKFPKTNANNPQNDNISDLLDTRGISGLVPHLGAHLAELSTIDEGNPDCVPDFPNLINLHKKFLLARTILYLGQLQKTGYVHTDDAAERNRKVILPIRVIMAAIGISLQPFLQLMGSSRTRVLNQKMFDVSVLLEPDATWDREQDDKRPTAGATATREEARSRDRVGAAGTTSLKAEKPVQEGSRSLRRYNSEGDELASDAASSVGGSPAGTASRTKASVGGQGRQGTGSFFSYLFGGSGTGGPKQEI